MPPNMFPMREKYVPKRALYGVACYHCITVAPQLKQCSRCKRVKYCNDTCQKANFSSHKGFCKTLALLRSGDYLDFLPPIHGENLEELQEITQTEVRTTTSCLVDFTETSQVERNLVAFEPRCSVCFRSDFNIREEAKENKDSMDIDHAGAPSPLIPCSTCLGTFACSTAHWLEYDHEHKTIIVDEMSGLTECQLTCRMMQDDDLIVRMGAEPAPPYVPERRRNAYVTLPSGDADSSAWGKWFDDPANTKDFPEEARRAPPLMRSCTESLSIPLTILYGIGRFDELLAKGKGRSSELKGNNEVPLHERADLEVALLGAASYEFMHGGTSFEEILHSLPAVKKLTVRLVGPELGEILGYGVDGQSIDMETCPRCRAKRVKRVHIHQTDLFHEYIENEEEKGKKARMPDIAVAFDTGMHEHNAAKAGWMPTIRMLAERGVPTIVTSFQAKEAEADGAILRESGCNVVIPPHANPWRSELAIKEPCGARGFYFINGFIQGFKGKV